jgi:protein SCO1/2
MKRVLLAMLLTSGCSGDSNLPVLSRIPDFALTERSSRVVKLTDLDGKVWIADFIFTQCAGICPAMSASMRKLQDALPSEVRLVSFSVDPAHDTPEVLSAYAQRFGADPERWLFLTGDMPAIHKLSFEGFKLAVESSDSAIEPIAHSSRFVLVDRKGHIRGYYSMEDEGAFDRLVKDVKSLL